MIESGISNWVIANPNIQKFLGQTPQEKQLKVFNSVYFSFIEKLNTTPGIVIDRLRSPNADDTLDRRTNAPGGTIEGRFQFGSVAQNSVNNPVNPSGYLSAALLSQALRRELMNLADGNAQFPDGTIVKDICIDDEFDAHYEVGGIGYLFRRVLLVTILFQETN
jgi:hypothetical protein